MAAFEVFDSGVCQLHPAGWVKLASGVSITRMPLWDAEAGLFCRWGAAEGAQKLAAMGLRLPTWQEYEALHALALFIAPYTLPTPAMEAADPKNNYPGSPLMTSEAWCRIHDDGVFAELAAAGWTGEPVANAGKHWCYDGAIYGWWQKNGTMVQPLSYFHEGNTPATRVPHVPPQGAQRDYATTCHAVTGSAPPAPPSGKSIYPEGMPAPATLRAKMAAAGLTVAGIASGLLYWLI